MKRRNRLPGRHYKLSTQSPSLAIDFATHPYIDREAMSARAVISTATIDRVGDSLVPSGCQLTNYEKNPVVLWAHGLEGVSHPIATSRAPDGVLGVEITSNDVQATAWFSQSSLEASQIFELIDEGIVRATSVRETPLKSRVVHDFDLGEYLIVEEWELEEWSWCAVGVNPDAVAKTLHRNRLGGQPILPSITKSLIAVAPTLRRFGVGLPTEKSMPDSYRSTDDSTDSTDDATIIPWEHQEEEPRKQPYGSTVVSATHSALVSACQNIESAMQPLENPSIQHGLRAILTSLREQITALEGLHSSAYPDQAVLKSDDEGGEDDEGMKAFLASGHVASLRLLGLGARLKSLVGDRNLTITQRSALTDIAKHLARLVTQSKSHQTQVDESKIAVLQQSIQELSGLVASISK